MTERLGTNSPRNAQNPQTGNSNTRSSERRDPEGRDAAGSGRGGANVLQKPPRPGRSYNLTVPEKTPGARFPSPLPQPVVTARPGRPQRAAQRTLSVGGLGFATSGEGPRGR